MDKSQSQKKSGGEKFILKLHHGITPVQQMISSCSGALITSVFVTPFDVVKIRLQSQQKALGKSKCFVYCNGLMDHICPYLNGNNMGYGVKPWYSRPGHFNGTFDALVKIIRYEGAPSLWSGLPPTLVMAVPATVIYFTLYDIIKYAIGYNETENKIWLPSVAGGLARVGAVTVITPLELIRTKMQSERLSYRQLVKAVSSEVRHGGPLSLWRGLTPTLWRDAPFSVVYWGFYEIMKARRMRSTAEPSFMDSFMFGATAGTISAILTTPFDVVKTYRQIELGETNLRKERTAYQRGTRYLLSNVYKDSGVKGLFAGIVPRVLKIAPACAIMISSYEFGKKFFKHRNEGLPLHSDAEVDKLSQS